MATGLSASYSLSGPSSTRRLGTEAGALRRASRSLRRQGFRNEAGKMAAAAEVSKIKNGGGIGSADEDIAVNEYNLRSMRGLASQQARSFDTGTNGYEVTRSADGTIIGRRDPVTGLELQSAPASGMQTAASGAQTPGSGMQTAGGGTLTNTFNIDTSQRGPFKGGLTRDQDRTPGNRASAERSSVLAQIRRESAANPSETRMSILARINRERLDAGKPELKFEAKDFAEADIAEADKRYAEAGRKAREAYDRSTLEASGPPAEAKGAMAETPATPEDRAADRLITGVGATQSRVEPMPVGGARPLTRDIQRFKTMAALGGKEIASNVGGAARAVGRAVGRADEAVDKAIAGGAANVLTAPRRIIGMLPGETARSIGNEAEVKRRKQGIFNALRGQ